MLRRFLGTVPARILLNEVETGVMTFMGISGAAWVKVSASAVMLQIGRFSGWQWFGAGGIHVFGAGGGMVVPDIKIARKDSCEEEEKAE